MYVTIDLTTLDQGFKNEMNFPLPSLVMTCAYTPAIYSYLLNYYTLIVPYYIEFAFIAYDWLWGVIFPKTINIQRKIIQQRGNLIFEKRKKIVF